MKYDRIKDLSLHRNDVVWVKLIARHNKSSFNGYEGPARVEKFNRFQDTKKWNISLQLPVDRHISTYLPREVQLLERV